MIEKQTEIVSITVNEKNEVLVHHRMFLIENGESIAESNQHITLKPGDDVSGQDARVQKICAALWA